MPEPIGSPSGNPYVPNEHNTCSPAAREPSDASVRDPARVYESAADALMCLASASDPAVASLTAKYGPKLDAFFAAENARSPSPTAAPAPGNSAPSTAPGNIELASATTAPNGAPPTAQLPQICAGTPPVSERPLASAEHLVRVDSVGRVAGTDGAGPTTQSLTPAAAEAFRRLREYAARDGIDVGSRFVVYSSFRSDDHQAALHAADPHALTHGFRAKTGTSTHRTGNALDITVSAGSAQRNNDSTRRNELHQDPASQWLEANAGKFGFAVLGVTWKSDGSVTHDPHWEPWHVTYNPVQGAQLPPSLANSSTP